jgi:hypothetical protein
MHFELTCPENIADFQIQKQQNVQKAGSWDCKCIFEAYSLLCFITSLALSISLMKLEWLSCRCLLYTCTWCVDIYACKDLIVFT